MSGFGKQTTQDEAVDRMLDAFIAPEPPEDLAVRAVAAALRRDHAERTTRTTARSRKISFRFAFPAAGFAAVALILFFIAQQKPAPAPDPTINAFLQDIDTLARRTDEERKAFDELTADLLTATNENDRSIDLFLDDLLGQEKPAPDDDIWTYFMGSG